MTDSLALPAQTFGDAMRRLSAAQKSSKGAPLYSLFVNRPLGRVIAAFAYRLGLRPNQITAVSAMFTFAAIAGIALLRPTPAVGAMIMGALCWGYALDSADGQLARLRGGGSTSGEWLDHIIDAAKTSALHLTVVVAMYRQLELRGGLLLIPLVFAAVAAVHFFGMILNEQLIRAKRLAIGVGSSAASSSPKWISAIKLPTDYGVLCLLFVTFGLPSLFVPLYIFLAAANLCYLLLILPKWFRDMTRLDDTTPTGNR